MKLKNIIVSVIVVVAVLVSVLVTTNENKPNIKDTLPAVNTESTQKEILDEDLSFAVIGDVHSDKDKLKQAISDLHSINKNTDALILNGDTVDRGTDDQYEKIKKFLNNNKELLPKKIIKNIGNHEFYDENIDVNSKEQVQEFIQKYCEFSGEKDVYHDTWIKNYHFISLGSEDGNSDTLDDVMAFISDTQQKWLEEKLAEGYQKERPIFVFLHQPLNNGTTKLLSKSQNRNIMNILSKYPEVVLFTSHTHYDLTIESVILNQPFTSVETGAVYYTVVPDKSKDSGMRIEQYIKGLYVEVKGKKVIIKGRDLKEKQWIFVKEISKF